MVIQMAYLETVYNVDEWLLRGSLMGHKIGGDLNTWPASCATHAFTKLSRALIILLLSQAKATHGLPRHPQEWVL